MTKNVLVTYLKIKPDGPITRSDANGAWTISAQTLLSIFFLFEKLKQTNGHITEYSATMATTFITSKRVRKLFSFLLLMF